MKSKTEQLDSLFDEWEQIIPEYKGKFVRDGIINEQFYQTPTPKILFIMKELNNPKQKEFDFREWWKEKIKYAFSHRIAEWSYGLLNKFPEYKEIRSNKNAAHNAIQHIAFMNIKKTGGGGNSELNRMLEQVKINFYFLHRQIEIIEPDIIITGISWKKLRNRLFPDVKWQESGYDIAIGKFKNSKVIDFYHPSSRISPATLYNLLKNVIASDNFKSL